MRLLAMVSDQLRQTLLKANAHECSFEFVRDAGTLIRALSGDPWSGLVLDPTLLRDAELEQISALGSEKAHSVLLCASFSRAAARCAVLAARHAVVDVYFTDLSPSMRVLQLKLRALRPQSACGTLLTSISENVQNLPPPMLSAVTRLFGALPLPQSVAEIDSSHLTIRRTLDRQLKTAGFSGARMLLSAVRLAWAWDSLRSQSIQSISDAAFHCGYSSGHELWVKSRSMLLCTPSLLARTSPSAGTIKPLLDLVLAVPPD